MTETLARLLLRLSEASEPTILWGRQAKPYFGREFDRLLDRGLLVEQAPAEEWDVCADCECGLDQRPIQRIDGSLVAACPFDHAKDVRLEPEDVRSFRVDAASIVGRIATASGFESPQSEALPGVWYLGKTTTQRSLFVSIARNPVLAPGLIAALRAFDPKSAITVVGPSLEAADTWHFAEAGVHFVRIADALAADGDTFTLDQKNIAPPSAVDPRLMLFRQHSKLSLDGTEIDLPPISFKLLWLLAEQVERGNGVVRHRQIEKHLWSTVVSKTAAADAVRNLRDALKKGSKKGTHSDRLVRTIPTQGYILDLAASDIRLMD